MTSSGLRPVFVLKEKSNGKPIRTISPEKKAAAIARAKELEKK
jgi:hypothetical protein